MTSTSHFPPLALCAVAIAVTFGSVAPAWAQSSYRLTTLNEAIHASSSPLSLGNDNRVHGNRLRFSVTTGFMQLLVSAIGGPNFGTNAPRPVVWQPTTSGSANAQTLAYSSGAYVQTGSSPGGTWQALAQQYLVGQRAYLAKGSLTYRQPSTPEALSIAASASVGAPVKLNPLDTPWAVNDKGWAVGASKVGTTYPVLWHDNKAFSLPIGADQGGSALAINSQNVIVGAVWPAANGPEWSRAARWVNSQLDWTLPASVSEVSRAVAVNEAGQILVQLSEKFGVNPGGALVSAGGEVTRLSPGKQVRVSDMNDAGTVIGLANDAPMIWHNGAESPLLPYLASRGLTLPAAWKVEPLRINESGSIVIAYTAGGAATPAYALLTATP